MNIFEGSRRISKLIAVMWVVGWCINTLTMGEYVHSYFRVDSPDGVPIRMNEQEKCEKDDAIEFLTSKPTSKDATIYVTLCFKSRVFDDGRKLIPLPFMSRAEWKAKRDAANGGKISLTAEDKKLGWGHEKNSAEVSNYTKKVADNFKFTKVDEEWADSTVGSAHWEKLKVNMAIIIGCLAFLWIFSWCVGWIVRGFAGIPPGQDRKPDD